MGWNNDFNSQTHYLNIKSNSCGFFISLFGRTMYTVRKMINYLNDQKTYLLKSNNDIFR